MRWRRTLGPVLSLVLVTAVSAQQWVPQAFLPTSMPSMPSDTVLHVTDALLRQPSARQAIATRGRFRSSDRVSKNDIAAVVGDHRVFRVRDIAAEDTTGIAVFLEIDFTLRVIESAFNLWVETAEIDNAHVRQVDLEDLRRALADATPATSVDPDQGIIVNDESVFGQPPDVDASGRTDVLLTDIRDGWTGGGFVAGYVDPLDLFCLSPATQGCTPGNHADILYLDTFPSLFSNGNYRGTAGLLGTAAHEYQHLIHFNYDPEEITFTNEGLSEYAEVINGFEARPITYVLVASRYNVPLFRWSFGLDTDVFDDYERAGLFTNYFGDRLGTAAAGSLVQTSGVADDAYRQVLDAGGSGLAFEDLLLDFHTANFVNIDEFSGPTLLGYHTPQRADVRVTPTRLFNGAAASTTPAFTDSVEAGGVLYFVWDDVSDFQLSIDVTADELSQEATLRSYLQMRLILETDGGGRTLHDVLPQGPSQAFDGVFTRAILVVAHARPETSENVPLLLGATWGGEQNVREETFVYDDGTVPGSVNTSGVLVLEAYSLASDVLQANRFPVPEGSRLIRAEVAPYYESQFDASIPAGTTRDFQLHVWTQDENGRPGAERFTRTYEDNRLNSGATLNFMALDLSEFAAQLSGLGGYVYVGISNAGTDVDYLVAGVSRSDHDDDSFLFLPSSGTWTPLSEIRSNGETILQNRVVPIRATFLVPLESTAGEGPAAAHPTSLEPAYPNPASGSATLVFTLSRSTEIILDVFDALGRRVLRAADGSWPSGRHQLRLDTSAWGNGVYFVRMTTPEGDITRTLTCLH